MRLLLQRAELHGGKFIGSPLLFKGKKGSAHIGAAGDAVNDHA
jgi:hypothetical protein